MNQEQKTYLQKRIQQLKSKAEFAGTFQQGIEAAACLCESKANNHGWDYHLPSVGRELAAAIRDLKHNRINDKKP